MLLKIVLIFAIAAKGSAYCIDGRPKDVCFLDPKEGRGRGYFKEWYYDTKVGKCSQFVFGDAVGSSDENRFKSESECNALCRSEVPGFCFEGVKPSTETHNSKKWTYKSSSGQCVQTQWNGGVNGSINIFNSRHDCEEKCKIPDLGPCGKSVTTKHYCKQTDDQYYLYDTKTDSCRVMEPHECPHGQGNIFTSFFRCNQRCGRFIKDKCKMPIQNMTTCVTLEPRFGYNKDTKMCEEFLGCDDGGNSFPKAKQCWETCTKNPPSRCALSPDVTPWSGAFRRYYYDSNANRCFPKSQFGHYVSGKSNIFRTWEECKKACIAYHEPGKEY
ncbi:papilin-like [Ixodes scapularis]|uniref:papilin-like n=1 Tax=Ixodes scapularis TaxID=6945 RepID=UPI001A9E6237|nr:papilin-like [Ixodes scapularis]